MRILITGAKGFIGTNLVTHLRKEGFDIIEISRSLGYDFNNYNWVKKLPKNIDTVIHLAQSEHYKNFPNKAADIFNINVKATFDLLEWSRNIGVTKFIYASSGSVYQNKGSIPSCETTQCNPLHFYGATKRSAELMVAQYRDIMDIEILRLYTVYGPNQKEMLIPNIINSLKSNKEITLAQGVGLVFSSIFIEDCVKIITQLVKKNSNSEYLNISSPEINSLKHVINILKEKTAITPNIKITDKPINYSLANTTALSNMMPNYEFITLEQGLAQCIKGD